MLFASGAATTLAARSPALKSVSLFVDRTHLRADIAEDIEAGGMAVVDSGAIAELASGGRNLRSDIVLADCPKADGQAMAALARLDLEAAAGRFELLVSTTLDALEDVFACLDASGAEILVSPTRAERIVALGRAAARVAGNGVRELSEEDRLALLRLTEQVAQIATRLDRLAPEGGEASVFSFAGEGAEKTAALDDEEGAGRIARAARPPLPDPRLVRRIIRHRQRRARFFDGELFADPAWDMLLDLTAARAEHKRVSVTSLCIASGVPPTTALRWISQLVEAGLFVRVEDETDRRRAFIALSDKAAEAMARYFAELGNDAVRLV